MQSVATINSDVNHGIYKNGECCSVDAYNLPNRVSTVTDCENIWSDVGLRPIYKVYDNYATPIVAWSEPKPRMSLAHEFRNYKVITATAQETTRTEDHAMRTDLTRLILYSTRL